LLYGVAPKLESIAGVVFIAQWSLLILAVFTLAPFSRRREFRGFWRHNHAVVDKSLLAVLFSGAAFGGLALALVALEGLFGLHIHRDVYSHLATALFMIAAPWLFLAAYPADVRGLDSDVLFPGALRSFAQWVMVPLVSVYAAILLVYAAQIAVKGEWPKGMVGWLVSWAGALGLMTNLMLLPLSERHELKWLRIFLRGFYAALLVFAGLLALATYRRVSEYGWTEERVLLALLCLWFFSLALFFTLRPSATRKWIPASIGILALVTIWGPLAPSRIARRDQTRRLEKLLQRVGVLKDGKGVALTEVLDLKTRRELWDQLDFFSDRNLLSSVVKPLFPPLKQAANGGLATSDMFKAIGQPPDEPATGYTSAIWSIVTTDDEAVATEGLDRFVPVQLSGWEVKQRGWNNFVADGVTWKIGSADGVTMTIEDMANRAQVTFDLAGWANQRKEKFVVGKTSSRVRFSAKELAIDGRSNTGWKARLFLQSARVYDEAGSLRVSVDYVWLAFRTPKK